MTALQQVTLSVPGIEIECLELESVAAGALVLRARHCLDIAIRNRCGAKMIEQWHALLIRRVTELMVVQCGEVNS